MSDKAQRYREFVTSTDPGDSATPEQRARFERDKAMYDVLLELRDQLAQLVSKK